MNTTADTAVAAAVPAKPAPVEVKPVVKTVYSSVVARAPLGRSIIIPFERNQSLEQAIELALDPDPDTLTRLVKSFRNGKIVTKTKCYAFTGKKKKKRVASWKTNVQKLQFGTGIYIVNLDSRLNIVSAPLCQTAFR